MKTKIAMAALAVLASTAVAFGQESILEVRENAALGQTVTVVGVVTSDENLGSVRYIQDATAGIAIYPGQDWSSWGTPQIGDSLSVTGPLTQYNGLLEVGGGGDGDTLISVQLLGQGTVPTPLEITPSQLGEELEGQLVQINGGDISIGRHLHQWQQHVRFQLWR